MADDAGTAPRRALRARRGSSCNAATTSAGVLCAGRGAVGSASVSAGSAGDGSSTVGCSSARSARSVRCAAAGRSPAGAVGPGASPDSDARARGARTRGARTGWRDRVRRRLDRTCRCGGHRGVRRGALGRLVLVGQAVGLGWRSGVVLVGRRPQRRLRAGSVDGVDPLVEHLADDLERQEVVALLAQDPPQAVDVGVVELAVARRGPLGGDEPLALEEADLRDGHVREVRLDQRQHLADRQVAARRHLGHAEPPSVPITNTSRNLPTWTWAPSRSRACSRRSPSR